MTTATNNTGWLHNSAATFQAWVQEFCDMLDAVGLVYVPTTGSLDTISTLPAPATNSSAGYRVYRFNDSLQATAPLYMRFDFGTSSALTTARVLYQVATDVSAAGVLQGGRVSTQVTLSAVPSGSGVPRVSRMCCVPGAFWFAFKTPTTNTTNIGGGLFRSFDSAANPSGLGYVKASAIQNFRTQSCIFDGPTLGASAAADTSFIPSNYSSSVVGTDVQFWKHYMATPRSRCIPVILTTNINDIADGTQRVLTVAGGVARNYICAGFGLGSTLGGNGTTSHVAMAIWE